MRFAFFIIGIIAVSLGGLMLAPALMDIGHGYDEWRLFVVCAIVSLFFGTALILACRGGARVLTLRSGYLLTVGAWVTTSLFGALPLWLSDYDVDVTDAVFEAVSGLTTTGSTVLSGLDAMAPGLLLWRALLQWIGGVGIVVMAVSILPYLRVGGMQLFQMESSDKSEKIAPSVRGVAMRIVIIYLILTVACIGAYWAAGMGRFDALTHAMTTLATGGYSTHDASFGYFNSALLQWIGAAFMMAGAMPFAVYVKSIRAVSLAPILRDTQVQTFFIYVFAFFLVLTLWVVFRQGLAPFDAATFVAFNVASIITTTGYASTDYQLWGAEVWVVFFVMTFLGGCAGSTTGGIKAFRLRILCADIQRHFRALIYPHGVFSIHFDGWRVDRSLTHSVTLFFYIVMMSFFALTLGLAFFGLDLTTSLSAAATALANVGPGLGQIIGPSGTFQSLPDGAKWLLDAGMLIGRLEYFTVLILLTPRFWQEWRL